MNSPPRPVVSSTVESGPVTSGPVTPGSVESGPVARRPAAAQWRGVIAEYRDLLPVTADTPVVTLGEGGTPLVPAATLSAMTGCEVYLKVEAGNPTGSFKDRGMTVAVSTAVGRGATAVICASTGNTSASAAAYAAKAGLTCAVLVPRGNIALGKLAQALVHGARLLQVDGNFDDCLELVRRLAVDYPVALVNSVNADRLEGQKTAAFEVVDALGDAPDAHCLPVGNAGNIAAYWKGYTEYVGPGRATHTPRMLGFQASGGLIASVTDRQILAAYRLLARKEGVFGELASAAGVAGLLQACEGGQLAAGSRVVCTITGHGLKEPDWAVSAAPAPVTVPADASAAAAELGLA